MSSESKFDRSNGTNMAFGGNSFSVMNLDPGFYTVTCTRKYYGNISGPTTSYSRTLSVFPSSDPSCCPTPRCHEAQLMPDDTAPEVADLKFAAWPNPTQGKLSISFSFTTESEGLVKIALTPVNQTNVAEVILTESERPAGNYSETYYVSHLPNGIYLLTVKAQGTIRTQKLVISN